MRWPHTNWQGKLALPLKAFSHQSFKIKANVHWKSNAHWNSLSVICLHCLSTLHKSNGRCPTHNAASSKPWCEKGFTYKNCPTHLKVLIFAQMQDLEKDSCFNTDEGAWCSEVCVSVCKLLCPREMRWGAKRNFTRNQVHSSGSRADCFLLQLSQRISFFKPLFSLANVYQPVVVAKIREIRMWFCRNLAQLSKQFKNVSLS